LEKNGIPTAFVEQKSPESFVCEACDMLPLELVMRRFAWGSYLKREPELISTIEAPHRFENIKTEFFHKHAVVVPPLTTKPEQMEEGAAREKYLKDGTWAGGVYTDPLLIAEGEQWEIHNPKTPIDKALMSIPAMFPAAEVQSIIHDIMLPTFQTLEKAWANIETADGTVSLVDMKIEVGRRKRDGKIILADVIDNDSWRIWPGANPTKQLDKQCFREDHALSEVASNYQLVAQLTGKF
jgi:phosphoribosylaminoimidazole-succinocarboxamide synthase